MTVRSENYKLEILEYAVNQSIDSLLPNNSEDALSVILYQSKELIWRVATEIYAKSGHQVDFIFIKDILNLRIEPLRNSITKEATNRDKLKAERLAKEARIRNEKEAEVFERIKNVIFKELEVQKEHVKLDTLFKFLINESYNDFRNRINEKNNWFSSSSMGISDQELDVVNFLMAVEEEFDIEIDEQEVDFKDFLSWNVGQLVNFIVQND